MQRKDFGHESFSCAERMHRREEKRDEKKDICDECPYHFVDSYLCKE
jgi:hypothetical protein